VYGRHRDGGSDRLVPAVHDVAARRNDRLDFLAHGRGIFVQIFDFIVQPSYAGRLFRLYNTFYWRALLDGLKKGGWVGGWRQNLGSIRLGTTAAFP